MNEVENVINGKNTIIIAGFPGIGKSKSVNKFDKLIVDLDSSNYSKDYCFPDNYIRHIKSFIGNVDIILVSTHEKVIKALIENDIEFVIVYPSKDLYEEYYKRYIERGSSQELVDKIMANFNDWIDSIDKINNENVTKYKIDEPNTYLSDYIYTDLCIDTILKT